MAENDSEDGNGRTWNGVPWTVSLDLVTSCAYAVIASVDCLAQSARHNEGPVAASVFVIGQINDFNEHAVLLCSGLPFLEETNISTIFHPISMIVAVTGVTGILAPTFEAGFLKTFTRAIREQRAHIDARFFWHPLVYTGLPFGLSVIARRKRNSKTGLKLCHRVCFLLSFMSMKLALNSCMARGYPGPPSAIKITDLDQAAALGTTLISIAYTWRDEAAWSYSCLSKLLRGFAASITTHVRACLYRKTLAGEAQSP